MFIRTKLVNGNRYAYLVENEWHGRTKQKVRKYLGKAVRLEPLKEIDFCGYFKIDSVEGYVEKVSYDDLIGSLIEIELARHGFEKKENSMTNGSLIFDLRSDNLLRISDNKPVVLDINEGLFCHESIEMLRNFRIESVQDDEKDIDNDYKEGYKLAKAFVDSGLKVPKEAFVAVFGKLRGMEL